MKLLYFIRLFIALLFVLLVSGSTAFSQGGLDFLGQSHFSRISATHNMAVGAAHIDGTTMYWSGSGNQTFDLVGASVGNSGNTFGYVAKVALDGSVTWRIQINGTSTTGVINISGITTDASGNVYVAGNTNSSTFDFDPGAGTSNLTGCGFLAKYSSAGALTWVKNIGTSLIGVTDVAISPTSGDIWISASAKTSVDINPAAGVVYSSITSFTSTFLTHTYLAAYTAAAGAYVGNSINTAFGTNSGNTNIQIRAIGFDKNGKIYATGDYASNISGFANQTGTNFGVFTNPSTSGTGGIFTARVDVSTLPTVPTAQIGVINELSSTVRTIADIAVDGSDNVYITGASAGHPFTVKYNGSMVKQWEKEETTITGEGNAISLTGSNVMITGSKSTGLLAAQYTTSSGANGFGNYSIIPQAGGAGIVGEKILISGSTVYIGTNLTGTSKNVAFNLESFLKSSSSASYSDVVWVSYLLDKAGPTCVITTTEPSSTPNGLIPITYTFNEPVYNFDQGGDCVNCETSSPEKVNNLVYTGYILPSSFGAFSLQVGTGLHECTDGQKNEVVASNKLQMTYVDANPTILFNATGNDPSLTNSKTITVNFSEAVTGFTQSDLVVTNGVVSAFTAVNTLKYTFTLTASAEGLSKVEIQANVALDNTSTGNIAATYSFTWDATGPVATITTTAPNPTPNNIIPLKIIFNEAVTGFAKTDIIFSGGTGSFPSILTQISPTEFNVAFSASTFGTFLFSIATGSVTDALNNPSPASGTLLSITYGVSRPAVTITSPPSLINGGVTGSNSFDFTITFDQNLASATELTAAELVLTNGTVSNFVSGDKVLTGKFTFTAPGIGTIAIPENVAYNTGALGNTAATPFSITYDNVAPAIVSYSPVNNATNVPISSNIAITFNKNMKKNTSGVVNVVRKSDSNILQTFDITSSNVTINNAVVTINPPSDLPANTEVIVSIAGGALEDANGSHTFYGSGIVTFTTASSALSDQTITFNALPAKTFGDAAFALTATASSSLAVTYASSNTAVATVSGSTVTIVGAGSANITASQAGNVSYNAATPVVQPLTVNKKDQTITFTALAAKAFGDAAFALAGTSNSGLAVTYTSSNPAVANVTGNMVTIVGVGSTNITASQTGNTNYNVATPVVQSLTVSNSTQTITFNALAAKTFGDAAFALTATASSGLAVTYTSSNTTVAAVTGSTVTIVGVGSTNITASQSGNGSFSAATPVVQALTVNKKNQTITFAPLSAKAFGDAVFALAATASSTLGVTYVSSNLAVATVSGNTVTIVGVGSTNITASQVGNTNYNAATPVVQALTVNKAGQTITFGTLASKTFGDASFLLTATASSSVGVTYVSSNTAVATVSGSTVTIVGAGSTNITASQAGNINYSAATPVIQSLTVNKAGQTITFNALLAKSVGDAAFALTATASSALSVTYSSSNTAVATVSGSTVTLVGAGSTTITASQSGNTNYSSATPAPQILTVNSAALQNQSITFGSLAAKTFGDASFSLSASATSGLGVTFSSSNGDVATVTGNTITIVGAGLTTITASQAGNATFNPAPNVNQTLSVNKANQTITFNTLAAKTFGDAAFTVSATSTSGLPITFSSANTAVATASGSTVAIISAGSANITASQSGNSNYNAASDINRSLTVNKASQTITFDALPSKSFNDAPFTLTGFSSSGLAISYSSSNTSVATVSGSTVTILAQGSTTISASQTGNINYAAASNVNRVLTVNGLQSQTISFNSIGDKTIGDLPFFLNASASSGLTVGFSESSSKISISGSEVSIIAAGRATITASQNGNGSFNAATPVELSFCINPAKPTINLSGDNTETPLLTSSSINGNQWFLNGVAISAETKNTLVTTTPGIYTVQVTVETCSSAFSDETPLIITAVAEENVKASLKLYPNPAAKEIYITWPASSGNSEVTIYQTDGKPMMDRTTAGNEMSIDVEYYSPGLYLIAIRSDKGNHHLRFIKK